MDNLKPPVPPDLGNGICVTFSVCKETSQYRACIHDGNVKLSFMGRHKVSYGEALAKAVLKRKIELNLVQPNIVSSRYKDERISERSRSATN